ncbi:uncharacterized protein isoform X2 [Takifugu rubripes]|uniref:Uncharacterized LOC105418840 n=1 Tax=Takifugu rubripes TaxID=31033 RepID=A0A674MDG6_TAKRU|nr:uncharacterized protein LOC105418840 isoform X2 [Takifugu rubripes]
MNPERSDTSVGANLHRGSRNWASKPKTGNLPESLAMPVSQLPEELWLHVFSFLPWKDKLNVRCTCSDFKQLLDKSRPLWRGFSLVLRHFSQYNRSFWHSLAQRHISRVAVCSGKRKHLRQLSVHLPALDSLRLDDWRSDGVDDLKLFHLLRRLSITNSCNQLKNVDSLFLLRHQLTQLSLCKVTFACSAPHILTAISQLTSLTLLRLHHDGSLRVPTLSGFLPHLPRLKHLSWTMIAYKTLPGDFFFSPAQPTGFRALQLSELQLLNYDAAVTQEVLQPLSHLKNLSIFHLYSVPGPTCHLQTWLASLQQLCSLSVHGGHCLAEAPHLEHLHLEPWTSSSNLIRLLPQLFPHLRRLSIRHRNVSDDDFLQLAQLQHLETLEVLDAFYAPDPRHTTRIVYQASPHLLQLISDLKTLTDHRVQVITNSRRCILTCSCV